MEELALLDSSGEYYNLAMAVDRLAQAGRVSAVCAAGHAWVAVESVEQLEFAQQTSLPSSSTSGSCQLTEEGLVSVSSESSHWDKHQLKMMGNETSVNILDSLLIPARELETTRAPGATLGDDALDKCTYMICAMSERVVE
eukprot:TRINITY_DN4624_c0_g1_i4.p1 TRINITY_DN4624_c0_g1~~TRINITY_DN4624_c0_g1_i4.p1  ORF type:complete len:141 (-),score=21.23 TRINITY_DN4624_c0_g1_i4:175-597(-)